MEQNTLAPCRSQQVALLHFVAVSNQPSAFVPVRAESIVGTRFDGALVTNSTAHAGRVVVVGEEPLLEALRSTNGQVQLILYALSGTTNVVETVSEDFPQPGAWSSWQTVTMTNLLHALPPLPATNRTLFIRAVR